MKSLGQRFTLESRQNLKFSPLLIEDRRDLILSPVCIDLVIQQWHCRPYSMEAKQLKPGKALKASPEKQTIITVLQQQQQIPPMAIITKRSARAAEHHCPKRELVQVPKNIELLQKRTFIIVPTLLVSSWVLLTAINILTHDGSQALESLYSIIVNLGYTLDVLRTVHRLCTIWW